MPSSSRPPPRPPYQVVVGAAYPPAPHHRAVRQDFTGLEITVAAEIVPVPIQLEAEFRTGGFAHFEGFTGHFRSRLRGRCCT